MTFLEFYKMQFIHQELEHNLWQIENIDSRIFEDTQCVIQEIASKYTNMKVIKTKQIMSMSDGFISFKHTS